MLSRPKTKIVILASVVVLSVGIIAAALSSGKVDTSGIKEMAASIAGRILKNQPAGDNAADGVNMAANGAYTNAKYGFSFENSEGLTITDFSEGEEGDVILIKNPKFETLNSKQNQNSNDQNSKDIWAQIFILPWDEEGVITPERIHQDLPAMVIEEPQQVIITQNQITGLIFYGNEEPVGKTREVWFAQNGYLYQITTYAGLDNFIGKLLESWEFRS